MRVKLPLLRTRSIAPARAPFLRYGVAVLSIILALIPALMLSDVVESRLVVFAVAIMVSAWYGGWKPGLVATTFALTVSAYFSLAPGGTPAQYRKAIIHLLLFVFVALLICSFNAALRSAQEGLRRSEVNFRSLVTNAPYGICRCDAAGILLSANPAMVRMLGYSSPDELTGRNLANLYADAQHWFTVADALRTSQYFNSMDAEWIRRDGTPVTVRLSGRTIKDEHDLTFFELFAEDVTERRTLEQQLRQSQKMEAVGRLAGGIAHDFNNLLMVISGYCELLLDRIAPGESSLRAPAQEIANAAGRATTLTRQLLAFSRKQMMMPKVFDLNSVVSENLRMLNRLIGEDIDLEMIPSDDLGLVKADPGQIEQVIMNLAVNARDAMPKGGKLTIETTNVTLDESYARHHAPVEPGEYVMLAMSDTGAGMDAETQTHIFEPFYTTKQKGTGLGLSTVYGIVKQSGGYIWVYSEAGKGTTFKIYLPRVSEAGEPTAPAVVAQAPANARGHETILLVEDEATVRQLALECLKLQGYNVLEAPEGGAALLLAQTHGGPIHLLLTDVIMPGMTGRELANQLTRSRPGMKVLYMSGYTENAIGHNGTLDAGVMLLQKPFSLPTLRAKVREVLDMSLPLEAPMATRAQEFTPLQAGVSSSRAQRFQLQLPLKYRPVGEASWRAGTTENISRSGLLFRAEKMVEPHVVIEINLVLPAEIAGLSAAEVVCRGEVVRAVQEADAATNPALAARILQYHFRGSQIAQA
jgi:PAS domain S-box-containing protein